MDRLATTKKKLCSAMKADVRQKRFKRNKIKDEEKLRIRRKGLKKKKKGNGGWKNKSMQLFLSIHHYLCNI
jgi:hypothetical protein